MISKGLGGVGITKRVLLWCGLTVPLLINNGRPQCQQQLALESGEFTY